MRGRGAAALTTLALLAATASVARAQDPAGYPDLDAGLPDASTEVSTDAGLDADTREIQPAPAAASPIAILSSGDRGAIAKLLGISPSAYDDPDALDEARARLSKRRDATADALATAERELRWTQELKGRLERQRAATTTGPNGLDAAPTGAPMDPEGPDAETGPIEQAPELIDEILDNMVQDSANTIETLAARLKVDTASLATVMSRLEDLNSKATKPDDDRLVEARAARDAVERERRTTEAATNQAQDELVRVKAEQRRAKHTERKYRQLARLDTQLRSEEIFILARVQDELFREVEHSNKVVAELSAERKATRTRVTELQQRLDDGTKTDITRREAGDIFDALSLRRTRARARTLYSKSLLDEVRTRLDEVSDRLDTVEATAKTSRRASTAEPDNALLQKTASVDEARRTRLRAHQLLLEHRRRLYVLQLAIAEDEVHFAKRTQIDLLDMVPESKRSEVHELSDANLRGVYSEGVDLLVEAMRHGTVRKAQVANLLEVALSLPGIWWLIKALLAIVGLYLGVKLIKGKRHAMVDRLTRRALKVSWLRSRQSPVVKGVQLVGEVAGPVSVLIAARVVLWLFPADAPLIMALSAVINGVILYIIAIRALRTLALPRWYRESTVGATTTASERSAAQPPELQRSIFFVATLRLLLLYTAICQVVLLLVREALGMFFIGNAIHILGVLGYVVVVYVLLTRWQDTIARLFAAQLRGTSERTVAFVETHKDRIYGILVIFAAFLYVVSLEGWRFVRKYVTNLDIAKQLQNFLFRRRIEYRKAKAEAEAEAEAESPPTLAPDLRELFESKPLTDEPYLVARGEHEALRASVALWRKHGRPSRVSLVGFQGTGKTTALNQLVATAGDREPLIQVELPTRLTDVSALFEILAATLHLETDRPWETTSLVAALTGLPRSIIVVDDAHRLFERRIGGFEALQAFEHIMTVTGRRHLWVASFDAYAWIYLRNTQRKPQTGTGIVHLDKWSDSELRLLVDGRMDQTPLQATFEGLNLDEDPAHGGLVNLDQSAGGYFRLLEEATRGNPWVAMNYWLASLIPVNTVDLRVNLFQPLAKKRLLALNDDAKFVLVALLQHGELSLMELATILAFPPDLVAAVLATLDELEVLDRRDATEQVRVSAKTFAPVTTFLESQNLLHV